MSMIRQLVEAGDWQRVSLMVQTYEDRIAELERSQCERLTATLERDTLRHALNDERKRHSEVRQLYEVLRFRTAHQMFLPMTEDQVPDNGALSVEQQSHVIVQSFGLPDIPPKLTVDPEVPLEEAVRLWEGQWVQMRQYVKQCRAVMLAQVQERLQLKRIFDQISGNSDEMQAQVDKLRQQLQATRAQQRTLEADHAQEVKGLKDRLASVNALLAAEVAAAATKAKEQQAASAQTHQKMMEELERLRGVERRLQGAEEQLKAAQKELVQAEAKAKHAPSNSASGFALEEARTIIQRELKQSALAFNELPFAFNMKIIPVSATPTAAGRSATQLLSDELQQQLEQFTLASMYVAKLLEEKLSPEVQATLVESKAQIEEITSLRQKLLAALLRVDLTELGETGVFVEDLLASEEHLRKLRKRVKKSISSNEKPPPLTPLQTVVPSSHHRGSSHRKKSRQSAGGLEHEEDHDDEDEEELHPLQDTPMEDSAILPGPRVVSSGSNNTATTGPPDVSLFGLAERVATADTEEGQQSVFDSTWRSRTSLATPYDGSGRPPLSREMDGSARSLPTPSERLLAVSQRPEPHHGGGSSHRQSAAFGEATIISEGTHRTPKSGTVSAGGSGGGGALKPPRQPVKRDWSQSHLVDTPIMQRDDGHTTADDEIALWEDTPAVRTGPFAKAQLTAAQAVLHVQQAKATPKLLQSIDEERKKNLSACLAILDNAQRAYAKARGIRLPPLPGIDNGSGVSAPPVSHDDHAEKKVGGGKLAKGLATQKPPRSEQQAKVSTPIRLGVQNGKS